MGDVEKMLRDLFESAESRVTSDTGGAKGSKVQQLGAVDPIALWSLAKVAGQGAQKYSDRYNYLKGYDWSLSYDALMRHALLWNIGFTEDAESGENHMAHVAWHALCLVGFGARKIGTDDRPALPNHMEEDLDEHGV